MEEKIFEILESIGLHKNEIIVYFDLIKVGHSSAHEISHRTKIHRPNVYDILDKLIKKGIVTQSIENNVKIFYPVSPKNLLNYLKQKEYDLKKVIPEIEKIHSHPPEKRRVTMSEGIKSFRIILDDLLEKDEPIYVYGIPKGVDDTIGGFIEDFHERRIKKGVLMKHIYNKDAQDRIKLLNKMDYTEARYFPSDYNTTISTLICGNIVLLIFWEDPISTILIENRAIAEAYKNYFDILWEEARLVFNSDL
jgi:sugar-specific transcriptional regulator TrmB